MSEQELMALLKEPKFLSFSKYFPRATLRLCVSFFQRTHLLVLIDGSTINMDFIEITASSFENLWAIA